MFEALFALGFLALLGALALFLLKVFFGLLVLPFRLAFWVAKGLIGLLVGGLLLLVFFNVFSFALPFILLCLLLPLALAVGFFVLLFRLVF